MATVIVAVIYIPSKLGGFDAIFGAAADELPKRGRADELDETRERDYDELRETHEPAPTVGAGVA